VVERRPLLARLQVVLEGPDQDAPALDLPRRLAEPLDDVRLQGRAGAQPGHLLAEVLAPHLIVAHAGSREAEEQQERSAPSALRPILRVAHRLHATPSAQARRDKRTSPAPPAPRQGTDRRRFSTGCYGCLKPCPRCFKLLEC